MRTFIIILLRTLLVIFDFIETVLAVPAAIVNALFSSRIRFFIRWLIVSKRKRTGLLKKVRRWDATVRLEKMKKKKAEIMHELLYVFTSAIMHKDKK